MKFCALTKKEVEVFSSILDQENISYEISVDNDVVDANEESMKFNLRHLNAPSISTAVLCVEVDESFWGQLSEASIARLEDIDISQISAKSVQEISLSNEIESGEKLRSVLNHGSKRLIGVHFFFYFIVVGTITFLISYFRN